MNVRRRFRTAQVLKLQPDLRRSLTGIEQHRPVPFAGELFAGVSCAPSRAAAKRFGAGEVEPAVSLSMIVSVAVLGDPSTLPPGYSTSD